VRIRALLIFLSLLSVFYAKSQHRFYRTVTASIVSEFQDSANRIITQAEDSLLKKQLAYTLSFFPELTCKNILVDYRFSKFTVRSRPFSGSVLRMPSHRRYKMTFSKSTFSIMDSVLIQNLSFNSQIGLLAVQLSLIEDVSTGGLFNLLEFYFKSLSPKGRNKLYRDAEVRCLELGLGHQLLSYNLEFSEKLKIENWQSVIGYDNYIRYYRNRSMKPDLVRTFLNDLPVYIQNSYR